MTVRRLAANSLWSLLNHAVSRGSLMASSVILARSLPTPAFAEYSYFQLTATLWAAYASMGMGVTASRIFSTVDISSDSRDGALAGALWKLSALLAAMAFVVVMALPVHWLQGDLQAPRTLLALAVATLTLQVVPDGALLGLERFRGALYISLCAACAIGLGVVASNSLNSPRPAMLAVLLASGIQTIAGSVLVSRVVGWRRLWGNAALTMAVTRRVLGFSGPLLVASLLSASGMWILGRIILDGPDGARQFALFTIGLQWFALAMVLPGMVSRVLLPRLMRSAHQGADRMTQAVMVRHTALLAVGLATVVAAVGMLASPYIMAAYGSRYSAATPLVFLYLGAAVASAPANTLGNAIVADGGHWRWMLLSALWWATLVGTAGLLSQGGAESGGIALAVAYSVLTVGAFVVVRMQRGT